MKSQWIIELHSDVRSEIAALPKQVRISLGAALNAVEVDGPDLGRPRVDTLKGSKHTNMKELRFDAEGGVWRFAFAFDVERSAVVLVGGDKQGKDQRRFYEWLIATADARLTAHIEGIEK